MNGGKKGALSADSEYFFIVCNPYAFASQRRLLSGKSHVMTEHDYALVEDTKREKGFNPIVACVSLQQSKAYYGSTDVTFGKPELIATDPVRDTVSSQLCEVFEDESSFPCSPPILLVDSVRRTVTEV